jgi:hypothetical protein
MSLKTVKLCYKNIMILYVKLSFIGSKYKAKGKSELDHQTGHCTNFSPPEDFLETWHLLLVLSNVRSKVCVCAISIIIDKMCCFNCGLSERLFYSKSENYY